MEPWFIGIIAQAIFNLLGFAALAGIVWSKVSESSRISKSNQDVLGAISVSMATALVRSEEITVHVGDLEIRMRRLEGKTYAGAA